MCAVGAWLLQARFFDWSPQLACRARGCHTALTEVVDVWKRDAHWFTQGHISDCSGSIDHDVILSILRGI